MKALKISGIIFAAVILTTLAIDASDSLSGKGGTLLAGLAGTTSSVCPDGMVQVPAALTFTCVDEFELAAGNDCIITNPENQIDTEINLAKKECLAINATENQPWRFINREQAAVMCTRSGKRLPSASEWYQYVLGTDETKCNIKSSEVVAGDTYNECVSAPGVRNGVGNVWEWVADDVIDGMYQGRALPETGYVLQVDNGGMVVYLDTFGQMLLALMPLSAVVTTVVEVTQGCLILTLTPHQILLVLVLALGASGNYQLLLTSVIVHS
jgi:hypothetical protein